MYLIKVEETKKISEGLKLHKDMVLVWGDRDYGFGFDGMVEKSMWLTLTPKFWGEGFVVIVVDVGKVGN